MAQALSAQQSGSLELAETLYREALAMRPEHPDALHMLGVVCHCLARFREAARLIRRAGEITRWGLAGHPAQLRAGPRLAHARPEHRPDREAATRIRSLARATRCGTTGSVRGASHWSAWCMPVHNHAAHVEQALESVFAQTYRNIELIVVDDGSSDDSAAVIRRNAACLPDPVPVRYPRQSGSPRRPERGHSTRQRNFRQSARFR